MGRGALSDLFVLYDTLLYGIELPPFVVNAINRKTEQYYISEEFRFRIERERGICSEKGSRRRGSATSSRSWPRASDSVTAVARDRGHAAALAIDQLEGRDHRQREGRLADHPRQRGWGSAGEQCGSGRASRQDTPTTAAGPAMPLEKTAPSSLTAPPEKMPAARSDASSAAAPVESGSTWLPSFQQIDLFLGRIVRPGDSQPAAKPDAASKPTDSQRQAK